MKIINKYEEKLRDSISKKSDELINDLIRYFNNSDSTDIDGREEDFLYFTNIVEDKLYLKEDLDFYTNEIYNYCIKLEKTYKDLDNEFNSFAKLYRRVLLRDMKDLGIIKKDKI